MKLTIELFQKLNYVAQSDLDEVDKAIEFVRIFTGKSAEEIDKLSVKKFNRLCNKVNGRFNKALKLVDNEIGRAHV